MELLARLAASVRLDALLLGYPASILTLLWVGPWGGRPLESVATAASELHIPVSWLVQVRGWMVQHDLFLLLLAVVAIALIVPTLLLTEDAAPLTSRGPAMLLVAFALVAELDGFSTAGLGWSLAPLCLVSIAIGWARDRYRPATVVVALIFAAGWFPLAVAGWVTNPFSGADELEDAR